MSLANLFNRPQSLEERMLWSFSNADSHARIVLALFQQKGLNLPDYNLDPMPEVDIRGWLLRHQQAHSDFEPLLRVAGDNYFEMDLINQKDAQELEEMLYQHATSHLQAHAALGIPG